MNIITSYCRVNNNAVSVNGSVIAEGCEEGSELLDLLYEKLSINYPKFFKMDQLSKLGIIGTECLFGHNKNLLSSDTSDMAVILWNADSSEATDIAYFTSMKTIPSPSLFVYTLPNIVAGEICIRYGFKGETAFFVSADFDANQIVRYTDLLLNSGRCRRCLSGWININETGTDLFLYTTETTGEQKALIHSPENVRKLYSTNGRFKAKTEGADH